MPCGYLCGCYCTVVGSTVTPCAVTHGLRLHFGCYHFAHVAHTTVRVCRAYAHLRLAFGYTGLRVVLRCYCSSVTPGSTLVAYTLGSRFLLPVHTLYRRLRGCVTGSHVACRLPLRYLCLLHFICLRFCRVGWLRYTTHAPHGWFAVGSLLFGCVYVAARSVTAVYAVYTFDLVTTTRYVGRLRSFYYVAFTLCRFAAFWLRTVLIRSSRWFTPAGHYTAFTVPGYGSGYGLVTLPLRTRWFVYCGWVLRIAFTAFRPALHTRTTGSLHLHVLCRWLLCRLPLRFGSLPLQVATVPARYLCRLPAGWFTLPRFYLPVIQFPFSSFFCLPSDTQLPLTYTVVPGLIILHHHTFYRAHFTLLHIPVRLPFTYTRLHTFGSGCLRLHRLVVAVYCARTFTTVLVHVRFWLLVTGSSLTGYTVWLVLATPAVGSTRSTTPAGLLRYIALPAAHTHTARLPAHTPRTYRCHTVYVAAAHVTHVTLRSLRLRTVALPTFGYVQLPFTLTFFVHGYLTTGLLHSSYYRFCGSGCALRYAPRFTLHCILRLRLFTRAHFCGYVYVLLPSHTLVTTVTTGSPAFCLCVRTVHGYGSLYQFTHTLYRFTRY